VNTAGTGALCSQQSRSIIMLQKHSVLQFSHCLLCYISLDGHLSFAQYLYVTVKPFDRWSVLMTLLVLQNRRHAFASWPCDVGFLWHWRSDTNVLPFHGLVFDLRMETAHQVTFCDIILPREVLISERKQQRTLTQTSQHSVVNMCGTQLTDNVFIL